MHTRTQPDLHRPAFGPALLAMALALSGLCSACDGSSKAGAPADADVTRPDLGIDDFEATCADPAHRPGTCAEGIGERRPNAGNRHLPEDEAIVYEESPPSSGNHRGVWAKWGRYEALPAQRWLHNLEHGGVAFLYHPCASEAVQAELLAVVEGLKAEVDGFRYILSPYPDLSTEVAVVAWEWRYQAQCVNAEEMADFARRVHNQAPEDIGSDGGYSAGFLGR
jgi:hypothetical protein